MAKNTIQFGRTAYVEKVEELRTIVDRVKSVKGTASMRKQMATTEALGKDVSVADMPTVFASADDMASLADIATFVLDVTRWAEQKADEQITQILRASSPDQGELDALKAQYASTRALVDAMGVMMAAQSIDVSDVIVPQLKATSTTSSGPRTVKTGSMIYYRTIDGERKEMGDSQQKLSSMAFYYGTKILGVEGKNGTVSTSDLTTWLLDNGVTSVTQPWSVEVNGVTYGMDVNEKV